MELLRKMIVFYEPFFVVGGERNNKHTHSASIRWLCIL